MPRHIECDAVDQGAGGGTSCTGNLDDRARLTDHTRYSCTEHSGSVTGYAVIDVSHRVLL